MKKICIVTATRAEYGLLQPLMNRIIYEPSFTLQILVTGSHLSPEFGLTYRKIEEDGYKIDEKITMLLSADTAIGIVKSMGLGMIGYADAFERLQPDALVILGDRYEMLAVASAAAVFRIPIVHLHGGEITEGAYDDAFRHAISKLSHLHFTATEEYRQTVIQMGESPNRVFNVGAIGVDNIVGLDLLSKERLERELNVNFKKYNYQITFHPETLSGVTADEQFRALLNAIEKEVDSFFIFTKANADTDGRVINQMIDEYVNSHPNDSVAFTSLGTLRFLSLVKICDAIIGNSSSAIIEAPTLKTAAINIGDRQLGRIQGGNVLNCSADEDEISFAIQKVRSPEFQRTVNECHNPYGSGGTAEKILNFIKAIDFGDLKTKKFHKVL